MPKPHPTSVPTRPRRLALPRTFAALALLAFATGAPGQSVRTQREKDAGDKRDHRELPATQGRPLATLDDEPDFAPMRRVVKTTGAGEIESFEPTGNPYVLSFVGGDFTPPRGVDPRMARAAALDPTGHTFGYVMIRGRLNDPKKMARLRSLGLELYDPHTWQSTSAKIPFSALPALRELPFVHWVGYAQPDQKIHPQLTGVLNRATPTDRFVIHVTTFQSDVCDATVTEWSTPEPSGDGRAVSGAVSATIPNGPYQQRLESLGFVFRHYNDVMNVHVFEGEATRDMIERIRDLDWVAFVELRQEHAGDHDQSMTMVGLDRVRGTWGGRNTPAGIIDSGLDSTPWHSDFNGKDFLGWRTTTESSWQDGQGHGTHVAGTVLGRGIADSRFRGGCPEMGMGGEGYRAYIGRYLDDNNKGQGNVNNLYQRMAADFTYQGVVNKRPRVVNCSWGSPADVAQWSGTESGARLVDPYAYNGQLYVFSSGNKGVGVGSPSSAKNVLTVAAATDLSSLAGTTASFSRSGVSDGRMKPEVAAPGERVTSCRINSTNGYSTKVGTSMAAPHVTAAMSGLVEHYSFLDYRPWSLQAIALACAKVGGRKTTSSSQGHGLINARKMHYTSSTSSWISTSGTIGQSGGWFYRDIAIPSDAEMIVPTLVWLEPAASSGATKARRSSLVFYLDNTRNNTPNFGQNNRGSTINNKIYATYTGATLAKYLGKTVRFKVYGASVNGACKAALCVLIYRKALPHAPNPAFTTSFSSSYVKPNGTLQATGTWNRPTTGDDFDNAWLKISSFGFTTTTLTRSVDGVQHSYTAAGGHPSSPYPSTGTQGIVVGQGQTRSATWTLVAPSTNGTYSVSITGQSDYDTVGQRTATRSICVDGQPPNAPTGLRSTTHTRSQWSNNLNFSIDWTAASDVGCAGIRGYGQRITLGGNANAALNLGPVTTYQTTFAASSGTDLYFNLQAYDRAGNVSKVAFTGPFRIDTEAPTNPTIRIENNAAITRSLVVTLTNLGASEPANGSGVAEMRFSCDGASWSPWEPFAATRAGWDLSTFGGNGSTGTKRTWAQYRDRAGNLSTRPSDTITYDPIDVRSISQTRGPLIGDELVTVVGDGFVAGQMTVYFGTAQATAVTVVDGQTLTCRTPANLSGGFVNVRAERLGYSEGLANAYEYVRAATTANGHPRLGITFPVTFNAPTDNGRAYLGAASFGQGPIPLVPHNSLMLSPDDLFFLTAENKIPTVFAAIQGTMNSIGQSVCQVTLPNVPSAVGASFYMAFVTLDPSKPLGIRSVATNRRLTIQP